MNTNTNAKTPRHIPRYATGYWRPVTPWNDGLSKTRKAKNKIALSAWTEHILAEDRDRERAEHFKTRRVSLALAIGEAVLFVSMAALWVYVCTL